MKKVLAIFMTLWANVSFAHFFDVAGVEVKVQTTNAVDGKRQAQSKSIKEAFAQLISEQYGDIDVSQISERDMWKCVHDFSIEKEKYSSSLYIGRFAYRFDINKVQNLLGRISGTQLESESSNLAYFVADLSDFVNNLSQFDWIQIDKFQHDRVMFHVNADKVQELQSLRIKCIKL